MSLRVVVYNVNGARHAAPAIRTLLTETTSPPDILVLNELKIGPSGAVAAKALLYPPSVAATYELFWNNGHTPHHGVAVFLRRPLIGTILERALPATDAPPLVPCTDADVGPPPTPEQVAVKHGCEGRLLAIRVESPSMPAFALVAVYVPNSGRGVKPLPALSYRVRRWDPDLAALLQKLRDAHGGRLMLTGDLNVAIGEDDVFAPVRMRNTAGFTRYERTSAQTMWDAAGLVDLVRVIQPSPARAFTYYSRAFAAFDLRAGWRLDYVLATKALLGSATLETHVDETDHVTSDHLPLHVTLRW